MLVPYLYFKNYFSKFSVTTSKNNNLFHIKISNFVKEKTYFLNISIDICKQNLISNITKAFKS